MAGTPTDEDARSGGLSRGAARRAGLRLGSCAENTPMLRIRNLILLWLARKAWKIALAAYRRRSAARPAVRT